MISPMALDLVMEVVNPDRRTVNWIWRSAAWNTLAGGNQR